LVVWEHDGANLLGELAHLRLEAEEIHDRKKDKVTRVKLINTRTGEYLADVPFNFKLETPKERRCGSVACIRFFHEGVAYRIEISPRAPTNWFGQSDDFLVCQVIRE
jgi:hypothetical protein